MYITDDLYIYVYIYVLQTFKKLLLTFKSTIVIIKGLIKSNLPEECLQTSVQLKIVEWKYFSWTPVLESAFI